MANTAATTAGILGLQTAEDVKSTSNYMEHPELIGQRIERLADIVGRERVSAGTARGFDTFAGIGRMDGGHFLQLAALLEGAVLATRRLWQAVSLKANMGN
jgi:5-methyltetrahydropteroyltriglutamate--homocysteine methyltransferase